MSLSRAVSFSANPRELTNTNVVRCRNTSSRMDRSRAGHTEPPVALVPSILRNGTTALKSIAGASPGFTTVTGCEPPRNRATSSTGLTVADNPMRCTGCPIISSRRSRLNARCAPRFVPATACTSSTITVSTPTNMLFALEVSSRNNDSGVVTRISGGWLTIFRRCSGVESPLRIATSTSGTGSPIASHC